MSSPGSLAPCIGQGTTLHGRLQGRCVPQPFGCGLDRPCGQLYNVAMARTPPGRMYVHHHAEADLPALRERGILKLEHATVANREHVTAGERATHAHDVYHVIIYASGRGSFLLHDEVIPFAAPYLVLTAPGQAHSFQGGREDSSTYHEMTFSGRERGGRSLQQGWPELLASRFGRIPAMPAHGPVSLQTARSLSELISDVVGIGFAAPDMADVLIQGLLEQLLFTLVRQQLRDGRGGSQDALEALRLLLEDDLGEHRAVAELARMVGLSSTHLTRAFKRRYGLPPVQYRRRWAMQQAATLIRSTALPVARIAERLGYADAAYFSRVFSSVHGLAPQLYRSRQVGPARRRDP